MRSLHSDEYRSAIMLLVAARKGAGMTQQELAGRLGKPQSFVAKYERGERRLDIAEYLAIARAMDTDPRKLIAKLLSPAGGVRAARRISRTHERG